MKKGLTVVIKLGTSSIVDESTHEPLLSVITVIVETAVKLRRDGYRVVIVSSGAIGIALKMMDMERRPKHLPQVQALAAIGQCRLMSLWDNLFGMLQQKVAQILLTRNDIADRTQYLNAQNTFIELLNMGVIPIVNENDTLSVQEIKFGDNDTLSAITAGMVQADYLFLMTDVDCLYDKNPRTHPDAKPIEVVEDIADLAVDVSSAGSSLGTGGMSTKIVAARLATAAGVMTVITRSSKPGNIRSIVRYVEAQKISMISSTSSLTSNGPETLVDRTKALDLSTTSRSRSESESPTPDIPPLHTRFLPDPQPIRDRYFWLLHGLAPHGSIYIDSGAHRALADKAGLLPVGVVEVDGHFHQHEAVRIFVVKRLEHHHHNHHHGAGHHPSNSQRPPSTPTRLSMVGSVTSTDDNNATVTSPWAYEKTNPPPLEVGRAIVNYSAAELRRIRGMKSTEIHDVLGYADSEYVALRENIAFLKVERSRPSTPNFGGVGVGVGLGDYMAGGGDGL